MYLVYTLTVAPYSHELYVYNVTYDMHKTFAPKLNGRYLSSNVNITVLDVFGRNVSVPVGGRSALLTVREIAHKLSCARSLRQVQDPKVGGTFMST